jgi:hypothetical protein
MEPYPTIKDVHQYEADSGLVGVDPVGAYFPVWVEKRPEGSPLEADYSGQGAVQRFDAEALPESAEILEAEYGPNRARIVVDSPQPFQARYLTFYFPGWRVWLDGEQVEVTPSDPEGLLSFEVPAGRHAVTIRFGETPLRLGADMVSGLALLALLVSTILMPASAHNRPARDPVRGGNTRMYAAFLVTAAALLLFKFAVVDRIMTPFRHPDLQESGTLPAIEHSLHQSYADGLILMGYDRSIGYSSVGRSGPMPADDVLRVDLYWTVRKQPSRRYQTVVHLVGPQGLRWSPKDSFRPTDYQGAPPTTVWEPGRYALDSHEVEPLPGTPPGRYDIVLTVFDRETLEPLSVLNEGGQPASPELVLGEVSLTSPRRHPEPEDLSVQHRVEGDFGPVTFLGANVSRKDAAPGDPVRFTTFWLAEEQPMSALMLHLELLGADGTVAADYALPPVASWYPTSEWRSGDVWRGQHLLHLPAALNTGAYTWSVSLVPSSAPPVKLSRLSVIAPDRSFTKPPVEIEIDIPLGNVATLLGADIEPGATTIQPGTDLAVTLFWRVDAETDISYRIFLHLIGPDGALVALSDGIPADWSRPTTGWLAGETIADRRVLEVPSDAPPGEYTVQAGLYTSGGGRLPTPAGAGAVTLTTVKVEE